MKKVIVMALAIVLVLTLGVTVTLAAPPQGAGAEKEFLYDKPAYSCQNGAMPQEGAATFGFVVLNTNASGDLIVEVALKGATPNAQYAIWVNQWDGDCPTTPTGTLMTNGKGNGNGHVVEARVPAATKFWVSAVGGGQVLRSPAVELD